MVCFLLTCDRECKEICKVVSVPADPVPLIQCTAYLPVGLELAKEVAPGKNHEAGGSCLLCKGFEF